MESRCHHVKVTIKLTNNCQDKYKRNMILVASLCYHAMKKHGRTDAIGQCEYPNSSYGLACPSRALTPAGLLRHIWITAHIFPKLSSTCGSSSPSAIAIDVLYDACNLKQCSLAQRPIPARNTSSRCVVSSAAGNAKTRL